MPPRSAPKRSGDQGSKVQESAQHNGDAGAANIRSSRKGSRAGFVRPQTAQQAVAEALRQDITTGKLAPGSWIVQESLAEQFGMSRIPIREALKTLEAEEYITYVPHSGYRVAKYSLEDLIEVFTLRAALEELLIRDAMPGITDDIIEQMRRDEADMRASSAAGDLIAVGVANRHFHFLTFQSSSMARTKRIVAQLWNTADAYRPMYSPFLDMAKVNSEHTLMIEAVVERDVERMVALNHQHRGHALEPLRRVFESETEDVGK